MRRNSCVRSPDARLGQSRATYDGNVIDSKRQGLTICAPVNKLSPLTRQVRALAFGAST